MEFNGTFFVTIISFLVFVFVMNKLLYEPVRKIVNERTDFINDNYKAADENNQKSEELSNQREVQLVNAKEDARIEYNELLQEYKDKRTNIVKTAQENSKENLEHSEDELNNISCEAKEALKWKMTDLANDIIEKIIGYRSEVQGFDNDKVNDILYH